MNKHHYKTDRFFASLRNWNSFYSSSIDNMDRRTGDEEKDSYKCEKSFSSELQFFFYYFPRTILIKIREKTFHRNSMFFFFLILFSR